MKRALTAAAIFAVSLLVRLLVGSLRWRMEDRAGIVGKPRDWPAIWVFWHDSLLIIPRLRERIVAGRGACALTSASRDGELTAMFLRCFGVASARGSSSRRGVAGMMALVRALKAGDEVAITPDGPRGPAYRLGGGVVSLAQISSAPLLPIHVRYSSCWRLPTWDGFIIPRPFARVVITLGELIRCEDMPDDDAFEAARTRIEDVLRAPLAADELADAGRRSEEYKRRKAAKAQRK